MGVNAATAGNGSKKTYELLEPGGYPARLVQVIDLGLQNQRPYMGQEKAPMQEIMLTYEFADEFIKDEDGQDMKDKPRWLSETMPLNNINADKANSTKRYKVLDPKLEFGGDFGKLLGRACNVTVVINPNKKDPTHPGYNNISGISAMRDKDIAKLPPLINKPIVFDLDEPDIEVFLSFSKYVQDKIKSNLTFNGSKLQKLLGESTSSNTPTKQSTATDDTDVDEDAPY